MKKLLFIAICIMAFGFSMTAYAKEFDPAYYASAYQDVAAAYGSDGAALFKHYTECGQAEGRIPYEGAARGEEVTFTPKVSEPVEAKSNKPADKLAFWLKKAAATLPRMYWTDEFCEQTAAVWAPKLIKCQSYANAEIISINPKSRVGRVGDPGNWFGPATSDHAYIWFDLSNGWIFNLDDYSFGYQTASVYINTEGTPEEEFGTEKVGFSASYYPDKGLWGSTYEDFLKSCSYETGSWYCYSTP